MKTLKILFYTILFLSLNNCKDFFDEYPNNKKDLSKPVESDYSYNGPKNTGLNLPTCTFEESAQPYDSIIIENNIPTEFDLSNFMPPVKSQGIQGSCVAFATTYYLKSFQEKIQNDYTYDSYEKVMSPAYVYNQCKSSSDCSLGTCFEAAFGILKEQGVTSWKEFPYDENNCSKLPTDAQIKMADVNKIKSFHLLEVKYPTKDYTRINVMKTLLLRKTPLAVGFYVDKNFQSSLPKETDGTYIYKKYDYSLKIDPHAMLIVGYDDKLEAFKVINSWGTSWGNSGYCYISYNFFREYSDPLYEFGLICIYFAQDQI